ncbi:MAG: hypothetical protein QXT26_09030 [Thermoproteota archaeon]
MEGIAGKTGRRRGRQTDVAEEERRVVEYLVKGGYSSSVRASGGKLYLRAVKGHRDQKSIGPLTKETKKILEKYGITLQQNSAAQNKEN